MTLEIAAALVLALLVLWLILQPLYRPDAGQPAFEEPEDPEETRRGIALIALKEIDFDRATGKLSDADYEMLKGKYTREALEAIREEDRQPAAEDLIERLVESRVAALRSLPGDRGQGGEEAREMGGGAAGAVTCPRCGPRPEPEARYCSSCGAGLRSAPLCAVCRHPLAPDGGFCGECGAKVAA